MTPTTKRPLPDMARMLGVTVRPYDGGEPRRSDVDDPAPDAVWLDAPAGYVWSAYAQRSILRDREDAAAELRDAMLMIEGGGEPFEEVRP